MWDCRIQDLNSGRLRRVRIFHEAQPLSYADVLARWQSDEAFRDTFIRLLTEAPQEAYLWETPPITRVTAGRPFEFVLADSPELARMRPDPFAFASHFEAARPGAAAVAFANLGGDAQLVAPTPQAAADPRSYAHLAAFARGAPGEQQHAFWRLVGAQTAARLSDRPLWLSTCGLGIAWLHARLDTWPKYYTHRPYRTAAAADEG